MPQVAATVTETDIFSSKHIANICFLCTEEKSNLIFDVIFSDGLKWIFEEDVRVHLGWSPNPPRGRLLTAARLERLFWRSESGSVARRARAHVCM